MTTAPTTTAPALDMEYDAERQAFKLPPEMLESRQTLFGTEALPGGAMIQAQSKETVQLFVAEFLKVPHILGYTTEGHSYGTKNYPKSVTAEQADANMRMVFSAAKVCAALDLAPLLGHMDLLDFGRSGYLKMYPTAAGYQHLVYSQARAAAVPIRLEVSDPVVVLNPYLNAKLQAALAKNLPNLKEGEDIRMTFAILRTDTGEVLNREGLFYSECAFQAGFKGEDYYLRDGYEQRPEGMHRKQGLRTMLRHVCGISLANNLDADVALIEAMKADPEPPKPLPTNRPLTIIEQEGATPATAHYAPTSIYALLNAVCNTTPIEDFEALDGLAYTLASAAVGCARLLHVGKDEFDGYDDAQVFAACEAEGLAPLPQLREALTLWFNVNTVKTNPADWAFWTSEDVEAVIRGWKELEIPRA